MPLRPIPRNPNGWDDKLGTRFRRLDTPRVHQAAAKRGMTISELVRDVVLREVDRLGIPKTVPVSVEQQAITFATSAPLMTQDGKAHTQAHVEAFRQSDRYQRPNGISRETLVPSDSAHSGIGMKDTPPRL